jgi:hypothetical protein
MQLDFLICVVCPSPQTDIPYFVPAHDAVFGRDCLSDQDGVVADSGAVVHCLMAAGKHVKLPGVEHVAPR